MRLLIELAVCRICLIPETLEPGRARCLEVSASNRALDDVRNASRLQFLASNKALRSLAALITSKAICRPPKPRQRGCSAFSYRFLGDINYIERRRVGFTVGIDVSCNRRRRNAEISGYLRRWFIAQATADDGSDLLVSKTAPVQIGASCRRHRPARRGRIKSGRHHTVSDVLYCPLLRIHGG